MQTLVSLFLDGFIFVADFKRGLQKGLQPNVSEMQEQLTLLFQTCDERNIIKSPDGSSAIYTEEIYDTAKFIVAAFIDEMLFSSVWTFANDWMRSPLQKTMFNTVCAGQEFFDKLEEISGLSTKEERDLAELFSYCIALGFQGAYYEDKEKLNFLMRSLYSKIVKHDDSYALYRQDLPAAADNLEKISTFKISARAFVIICAAAFVSSIAGITWYLTDELAIILRFFSNLYY